MDAHARTLMTTTVVSVRPDTSLADAARTLAQNGFSALPVVDDDDAPIGMVSDTDLMRVLLAGATAASVAEFMSKPVDVADEFDTADEVMRRMRERRIHHLPIVRGKKLVGIITPGDVVRWFVAHRLPMSPDVA